MDHKYYHFTPFSEKTNKGKFKKRYCANSENISVAGWQQMGLNSWGPTTEVCFKDVDWILNAFHVFTVTQLELKYSRSTILRRTASVLNSVCTWTSQINADLICRYTRQRHCLRASIKYQWPKSNWSRLMQRLLQTITNKWHPEIPCVHFKLLKIKIYWKQHVQKSDIDFKFDLQENVTNIL